MNRKPVRSAYAFAGALLVLVGLSLDPRDQVMVEEAPAAGRVKKERQKVHYATPGGTRIVWIYDPDFSL
jgi:Flp pilus assembly protein protease CpaA